MKEKEIYDHLVKALKEFYKDNLIGIYLFGSRARGDATELSDFDVQIVVNDAPRTVKRFDEIKHIIWEIEDKWKIHINFFIRTLDEFLSPSSLTFEVATEGQALYDKTGLLKKVKDAIEIMQKEKLIEKGYASGFPYWRINDEKEVSRRLVEACKHTLKTSGKEQKLAL